MGAKGQSVSQLAPQATRRATRRNDDSGSYWLCRPERSRKKTLLQKIDWKYFSQLRNESEEWFDDLTFNSNITIFFTNITIISRLIAVDYDSKRSVKTKDNVHTGDLVLLVKDNLPNHK
ncbi:hypothetical protein CEXT_210091 [Caerostris extrusa]|uniref:Uncharacterized protein n=1 Tax=Caerostris extrusa TaxID=172846 RepID=A0AAV4NUN5_CAEEX|nr:hypothetical protein CEXT_210091 [Caerostris extrusa]